MKLVIIPFFVLLLSYILKRTVDAVRKQDRYFHYGGWPSSHTALMVSLCTIMALEFGFDSPYVAISAVFTLLVISDALALRPLISKQSQALNKHHHEHLPDHVGHTWFEVLSGAIFSIIMTYILFWFATF